MQNLVEICPNCQIEGTLVRKDNVLTCSNSEHCDPNKDLEKEYLESLLKYCNIPAICYDLRRVAKNSQRISLIDKLLMENAADSIELLSNRLIERTESLVNQWKK